MQQQLRPELETPLPARMLDLPLDDRGYPVPWFVVEVDGKPEFRLADAKKWVRAINQRLCWVCGQRLGKHLTFVVGPMCAVSRVTLEPPCHLDCAQWSARNCPFLARPHMVRREGDLPEEAFSAGVPIPRNPGVTMLWTTFSFSVFPDAKGGRLIGLGDLESYQWYAQGKTPASRAAVEHSIDTGLPLLLDAAKDNREKQQILRDLEWIKTIYPGE